MPSNSKDYKKRSQSEMKYSDQPRVASQDYDETTSANSYSDDFDDETDDEQRIADDKDDRDYEKPSERSTSLLPKKITKKDIKKAKRINRLKKLNREVEPSDDESDFYYEESQKFHEKTSSRREKIRSLTKSVDLKAVGTKSIALNASIKVRNRVRQNYEAEHTFIQREIQHIRKKFNKFRKKILPEFTDFLSNYNKIDESYLYDYAEDLTVECKQKSLKNSNYKTHEFEILGKPKASKESDQTYLDYMKRFIVFKHKCEKYVLSMENEIRDLYNEHINKVCCNFYTQKAIENDGLEVHQKEIENNYELIVEDSLNTVEEFEKTVENHRDNAYVELKDIERFCKKINGYCDTFYTFIRMRNDYLSLVQKILTKFESLLKIFQRWVNDDRDFVDDLTSDVEYLKKVSNEKEIKRAYLQSRLLILQKKANKYYKEHENLEFKKGEFEKYLKKLTQRDELIENECVKIMAKIEQNKLDLIDFENFWSGPLNAKYESKHRFAESFQRKLGVVNQRLNIWLESRRTEQMKLRKTIKNVENTIIEMDKQINDKQKEGEPLQEELDKFMKLNKNVDSEIVMFNAIYYRIQKARKLKLSMKSYFNLQTGLEPADGQ